MILLAMEVTLDSGLLLLEDELYRNTHTSSNKYVYCI